MLFTGTSGNDTFPGTSSNDTFDLFQGGDDIADGGAGFDTFNLGAELSAGDQLQGGADTDTLNLNGDYNLVFQATTIAGIEFIVCAAGHTYNLTTADANVAAGTLLQINASALGATHRLIFDGSADADSRFAVTGGAGDDKITTGSSNDSLALNNGGIDKVNAGGGTDALFIGAALTRADRIDGGTGGGENDGLTLSGDYSAGIFLAAKTVRGIEGINLSIGNSYRLTLDDGNVASGKTLNVNGQNLAAANFIDVNGAAETDGRFVFVSGNGKDILVGGAGNDVFTGLGGADSLTGGGGSDEFNYNLASDSTSTSYDSIIGYDAVNDRLDIFGDVSGVDPAVSGGSLSKMNFDARLALRVNAGDLAADHAVLYTPASGQLGGHTFLIIDMNNVAGYQGGADLVIELVNAVNLGSFDLADFG
jgi:Ca2+-binding RTX toxin-like protein